MLGRVAAVVPQWQKHLLHEEPHQQDHAVVARLLADHRVHQNQKVHQEEVSRMDGADLPVN